MGVKRESAKHEDRPRPEKPKFSETVWFESGGRPVGFATCLKCGASVMIGGHEGTDVKVLHAESHA